MLACLPQYMRVSRPPHRVTAGRCQTARRWRGMTEVGRQRPGRDADEGRLLSPDASLKRTVHIREEFRTPLGVRKSPKNEPAGRWRLVWGFRVWATPERLGLGAGSRTLAERVGASEGSTSRRLDLVGAYWRRCLRAPVLGAQAASMTAAGLRFAGRSCRAGSRRRPPG